MSHLRQACRNIVIVDRDRSGCISLAALARDEDMVISFAESGREALRMAKRNGWAVWLIGVELTDMSGLDLCQMLRQKFGCAAICMLAQQYSPADEAASYRYGATFYVCESLDAFWLRECVRQLCTVVTRRCRSRAAFNQGQPCDVYPRGMTDELLASAESKNPWE